MQINNFLLLKHLKSYRKCPALSSLPAFDWGLQLELGTQRCSPSAVQLPGGKLFRIGAIKQEGFSWKQETQETTMEVFSPGQDKWILKNITETKMRFSLQRQK